MLVDNRTAAIAVLLIHFGVNLGLLLWTVADPMASTRPLAWLVLTAEFVLIGTLLMRRSRLPWVLLVGLDAVWTTLHIASLIAAPAAFTLVLTVIQVSRLGLLLTTPVRRLAEPRPNSGDGHPSPAARL
ncbi:hypothetical protein LY13_000632 [Prauserella aidingensis]|uniref:hypothetical protein n=1 Tax=Prauserella aidingensis TaxID=387890 RepID=UPI0020A25510|nr:hypothetical protein [Prauserella aidingensis]MCP2251901.1 hypothetical protein [Prauserella aidingensis]